MSKINVKKSACPFGGL